MSLLTVTNICKQFDSRYALRSISFTLAEGEVLSFLGPSGCGKTTLLRIIAGLETDFTGKISFDEKNISSLPAHKRNFGMMFQDYALFPHLSVTDNIGFGLQFQKVTAMQKKARISEMLELVGLESFAHRKVVELSGGERQRVALARSLAPQPRLLMLDEPLAALDRALRERLARDLRTIIQAVGVSAIFVTHDQAEAFAIADKVAVFHDGTLNQLAAPVSLYTQPINDTVARFLGFRNILPVTQKSKNSINTPIGSFLITAESNQNYLLIRPEGATISQPDLHKTEKAMQHIGNSILITGDVTEKTFVGQNYQVTIATVAETHLRFSLPLSCAPPEIGKLVTITIPESSLALLQ